MVTSLPTFGFNAKAAAANVFLNHSHHPRSQQALPRRQPSGKILQSLSHTEAMPLHWFRGGGRGDGFISSAMLILTRTPCLFNVALP